MVVDLPTPGDPVMPSRMALPVAGSNSCTSARAAFWWSARLLSISVMARASTARSPARTPRASRAMSVPAGADSERAAMGPIPLDGIGLDDHRAGGKTAPQHGAPDQKRNRAERSSDRALEEGQTGTVGLDHRGHEILLEHLAEHQAEDRRRDRKAVLLHDPADHAHDQHHDDAVDRVGHGIG